MRTKKTKADRIREYLTKNPNADVAKLAERFQTAKPVIYKLRKELFDKPIKFLQPAKEPVAEDAPAEMTWTATANDQGEIVATLRKNEVEEVLRERGDRYGPFENHAKITQMIKDVMRAEPGWDRLTYPQREALEMVAHKIGRMLNGDPTYEDNVVDILGYTDLMLRCMRGRDEL